MANSSPVPNIPNANLSRKTKWRKRNGKNMSPKYNLDKIKFATDPQTFEKAVALYESGKVTQFEESIGAYSAIVLGTKSYRVSVEARRYDYGHCECYLGQTGVLCKHQVATAICAVMGGKKLSSDDKTIIIEPKCSRKLGELSKEDLAMVKKSISSAMKYIKAYSGPSRTWFAYQNSLNEGCSRLVKIISELPVSEQTAKLLVNMLLRLDKKLCESGVDDSDGTVGGFMEATVNVLNDYAELNPDCVNAFSEINGRKTCFGWEEPLTKFFS